MNVRDVDEGDMVLLVYDSSHGGEKEVLVNVTDTTDRSAWTTTEGVTTGVEYRICGGFLSDRDRGDVLRDDPDTPASTRKVGEFLRFEELEDDDGG